MPNQSIRAIIETPTGSSVKYLLGNNGELWVSRALQRHVTFPYNYGFFPKTLEQDGDPLDVFVSGPMLLPRANIEVGIVGGIEVTDDRGRDTKLFANIKGQIYNSDDYSTNMASNTEYFLKRYKYDHEKVEIGNVLSREEALTVYQEAKVAYNQSQIRNDYIL